MVQYLIAVWDYAAEGEFELSFKQGDRIKLLEKHNDDWWEGELRDEIGFFPANRIRIESEKDVSNNEQQASNESSSTEPPVTQQPELPPRPSVEHKPLVDDTIQKSTPGALPDGWQHAYDDQGAIYYFNEHTGESRWDKPDVEELGAQLQSVSLTSPRDEEPDDQLENGLQRLNPFELKQLQLDQLQPEWIRQQGFIQMKMVAEKEDGGGKLSSWKVYYAVLSKGFLLLYKDSYSKAKKYGKPLTPIGSFDLDNCHIEPAGKGDTKRKHSFLINTPRKVTIYIQTANEKELSAWLDAIMRELIARKEGQNEDSDILRLLRKLTSDSEQMKVNRKMSRKPGKDADDRDWRSRHRSEADDKGKPKKIGNWFGKPGRTTDKLPPQPIAGSASQQPLGNEMFGGYLTMAKDGGIPRVVRMCIEEVEERGLTSVGIYRLSGPASSIQRYRAAFNCDEPVSFVEADINAVTGVLKLYFRELKNPLLTFEYYDWFIDAAREPEYDDRMYRIKATIHVLPKANFTVLEYLMRHLNRVADHSDINKMEASNLALIFSVGLLRPPADDLSGIMQTDLQSKVVEAIIQQVDWFFEKDEDEQAQDTL